MSQKAVKGQNTLVQATIVKKCDRTNHKPETNKACAAGTSPFTGLRSYRWWKVRVIIDR